MAEDSFINDLNNAKSAEETSLQQEIERLRDFHKSISEEFAGLDADDPEAQKIIKTKLNELVPLATTSLSNLLLHADSDSVRLSAAKFVITEVMKNANTEKQSDILGDLFAKLADNDEKVEDESNKEV